MFTRLTITGDVFWLLKDFFISTSKVLLKTLQTSDDLWFT